MTRTQRGDPADVSPQLLERGFEPSDVAPRGVLYAVLGLFAALILSGLLLLGMFRVFDATKERPALPAIESTDLVPPRPRLESNPSQNRAEIEAEAKARLHGYGWADREAGLARIPIEAAMRLLAARGWPDEAGEAQP